MHVNEAFAYSMRGRIIWIAPEIFHIPVLDDLYRLHQVSLDNLEHADSCTDYIVEYFHKLAPNNLIHSPLNPVDAAEFLMANAKISCLVKLNHFVNNSYLAYVPLVHFFQEDLHSLKKEELKTYYLNTIQDIKAADSLEALEKISADLVFTGIEVV